MANTTCVQLVDSLAKSCEISTYVDNKSIESAISQTADACSEVLIAP